MAKKRRKFHKIVIHPNRYLIWACAVALIVAAALVAYIYIGNIVADTQLANGTQTDYWHTYKDANFSMRYPADWLIDPGSNYVGFGDKTQDVFIVYKYTPPNDAAYDSYAKLPTSAHISVDGYLGIRVQDNHNNERIAFVKTPKILYEFRGTTLEFDRILKTVKFATK